MLTAIDKAIVPFAVSLVAWLNQKYGLHLDASPESLTVIVAAVSSIIVYFTPNKASTT